MSISLTKETKNTLAALSLESKATTETWADEAVTWANKTGRWGAPGVITAIESKNTISLTMETK